MIYADSSFLVARRVMRDKHHKKAIVYYEARQHEVWLWSPWHRVEVFNTIRQLTRHPESKYRLLEREAKSLIHLIEADVRVGFFTHMETDWRDVLRSANEISIAQALNLACRSADLLHVAYANELGAEVFVSFDHDQLELAKASGLRAVRPL
jgi:predicted nucleic acid-binding protein